MSYKLRITINEPVTISRSRSPFDLEKFIVLGIELRPGGSVTLTPEQTRALFKSLLSPLTSTGEEPIVEVTCAMSGGLTIDTAQKDVTIVPAHGL